MRKRFLLAVLLLACLFQAAPAVSWDDSEAGLDQDVQEIAVQLDDRVHAYAVIGKLEFNDVVLLGELSDKLIEEVNALEEKFPGYTRDLMAGRAGDIWTTALHLSDAAYDYLEKEFFKFTFFDKDGKIAKAIKAHTGIAVQVKPEKYNTWRRVVGIIVFLIIAFFLGTWAIISLIKAFANRF